MNQFSSLLLLLTTILKLALICSCGQRAADWSIEQNRELVEDDPANHVAAFESGRLGFERIEEYLQARDFSELPEDNLRVALNLLQEQLTKAEDQRDWPLIKALEQFVALDKIKLNEGAEGLCNNQTFSILKALNLATSSRARRSKSKRGPLRRIELVLAKIVQQHAEQCRHVYPRRFHEQLETFSRETIEQIDTIMKQLLNPRITDNRLHPTGLRVDTSASLVRRVLANFMDHNDSFKSQRDAKIVVDFLRKSVKANEGGRDRLRRTSSSSGTKAKREPENLEGIFVSHLLKPCSEYIDYFGPDIFVPAEYDAPILDRPNRFRPSSRDDTNDEFIDGWVRYGFCFMLKRDKGALMKRVEEVLAKE